VSVDERMVHDIVQKVMANMQISGSVSGMHGVFKDMNDAINASIEAQKKVCTMTLDQREQIISLIRKKTHENAEILANRGVNETGMGNVGDKILKHHLTADKVPGTEDISTIAWSGDRGLTLVEMGPFGVIGAILTLLALRYLLRIDVRQEEEAAGLGTDVLKDLTTRRISVEICNPAVEGKSISGIRRLALRDFVVSRICRPGEAPELADAATTLRCGDRILLVAAPKDAEALVALLGREVDAGPMMQDRKMISRRILITKPELNGKTLAELRIRSTSGVTITRINRSGIDLVAAGNLQLQLGDRVTVVGPELSVAHAERLFGNSLKRLNHPNLIPIFIGIALGVVLGSISFWIPGVPQPVKLGLAGGPLTAEHEAAPHLRILQKRLAQEITTMIHSKEEYEKAVEASAILFGGSTSEALRKLDEETLLQVFEGVPQFRIARAELGLPFVDLCAEKAQVFPSKGECRKMVQGGGVSLNKEKVADAAREVTEADLIAGKYLLVQKGKKNYFLLIAE